MNITLLQGFMHIILLALCLYFCGERVDLGDVSREMPDYVTRAALTSRNPVASARFFHVLVQAFLKHVLRLGHVTPGLFGDTCAYYGTVEQQGRLALHLHLLLWIKGSCLNTPTGNKNWTSTWTPLIFV